MEASIFIILLTSIFGAIYALLNFPGLEKQAEKQQVIIFINEVFAALCNSRIGVFSIRLHTFNIFFNKYLGREEKILNGDYEIYSSYKADTSKPSHVNVSVKLTYKGKIIYERTAHVEKVQS